MAHTFVIIIVSEIDEIFKGRYIVDITLRKSVIRPSMTGQISDEFILPVKIYLDELRHAGQNLNSHFFTQVSEGFELKLRGGRETRVRVVWGLVFPSK